MKKYVFIVVALAVCAACGMSWAMGDSVKLAGNAIYEKTNYCGDLSAADGLRIMFEARTGGNWLDYEMCFQEDGVECYINNLGPYFSQTVSEAAEYSEASLKIYATNTNASDILDPSSFQEGGMTGRQDPVENLYGTILEREQKHMETVVYGDLADYCEYYPISLMISIPGKFSSEGNGSLKSTGFLAHDSYGTGVLSHDVEKLNQFFRIPVDGQKIDITYRKLDDGKYLVKENNRPGANSFNLGITTSEGTATDDAIFFFINNRREDGSLVDTSQIPGGYGIYVLPYRQAAQSDSQTTRNDPGYAVDVSELETFYALDEECIIRKIGVSPDQSKLYLLTEEDGRLFMKVFSIESRSILSNIELGDIQNSDHLRVDEADGHIVIQRETKQYIVLDEKDGTYSVEMDVDLTSADLHSPYSLDMVLSRQLSIACDGERIAVIASDILDDSMRRSSGFTLLVLTKEGVQYFGEFTDGFEESNGYFNKRRSYNSLSWLDTENKLKAMFE